MDRVWASTTAVAVKNVHCEHCGNDYSYQLARRCVGDVVAPFILNEDAAKEEALQIASRRVARKLSSDTEIAPCPKCGWLEADMVRELHRRAYRWMFIVGAFGSSLCAASVLIGILAGTRMFSSPMEQREITMAANLAAIGIAFAVVFLGGRRLLVSRINPNSSIRR
ncbi:MAG TPA: hypothetical protein VH370_16025 [Humisphaera sp.]|nr:hypothetical protein [Humisphaera sp.]